MASKTIELELSRQQLLTYSAHMFVYLECQDSFREGPSIETVKDMGSRVFALCGQGEACTTLILTGVEARALTLVSRSLGHCYSAYSPSANNAKALRDLAMCRALLQRAKKRSAPRPEESEL